jgi:nucleoside-diphosphate-sugar epimerase
MKAEGNIIGAEAQVLITGAAGFIGSRVVQRLLAHGFRRLRCLVRPSSAVEKIEVIRHGAKDGAQIEIVSGNLLSRDDCASAAQGARVVFHLAAGRGEKLVADAFMNSVVTTRNLLEACHKDGCLRRFVCVSSFSVYSNQGKRGRLLDESAPVETCPELRGDAYTFAKVKQEEILFEYAKKCGLPYVIVRPGVVYGPGNERIHGRIGIGTFGLFLHLGGGNEVPLTYVDNCAEAIVLAGLQPGVEGEVFNVVDDDLPSSRKFLRLYKKNVRQFRSVYVPHAVSYALCYLWEKYSAWSEGQLPPVYGRRAWHVYWKKTRYTNQKLKRHLGWCPPVPPAEALATYFDSCRKNTHHA